MLKATCKELEARKQSLEELISTLEKEKDTEVKDEGLAEDTAADENDDADADQVTGAGSSSEDATYHSASSGEEST